MQEKQREEKIKRWFDMWLTGERQELSRLFDKNVYYSESWGPEYHGIAQLEHWFDDWTQQGKENTSLLPSKPKYRGGMEFPLYLCRQGAAV